MLASRVLLRTSRSAIGLGRNAAVGIPSVTAPAPARLFSSIRISSLKRPSIISSSAVRRSSILYLTSARFKSTTSTTPDAPTTPYSEFEPFDTVSPLDLTSLTEAQKSIPEHIGFLKELGLDFGWGPTSCMQWLLEHIHVWSGAPWWASIVLATVLLRTLQIPGYLRLSDVGARMKEVHPFALPIMERYKKAATTRDLVNMHLAKQELDGIYKKSGINKLWFFWPLAQLPIFYGFYNLLRSMAEIPVPGLVDGGVLWFKNLAVADPLVVLPLVSAGGIAMTLAFGGDTGNTTISPQIRKGLMIFMPLVSLFFLYSWPAAMTVYFATSSLYGLLQNFALRSATFRNLFGLYPIVPRESPASTPTLKVIDATPISSKPVDARSKFAEKVKSMMENSPPVVKNVSNWLEDQAKDRKHNSYDKKRNEEEAAKRRAVMEEKRRKRALKDEL